MPDNKKEQEREELHRAIWAIADDLRGSVDGWDFKSYVLGIMFYRYISENLTNYINADEIAAGNADFDYAKLSDEEAEQAREDLVQTKGFFILPSELFVNVRARAPQDDNLNMTMEAVFRHIEDSAKGTESEDDFAGLFDDIDVNSNKLGATVAKRNAMLVKLLDGIGADGEITNEAKEQVQTLLHRTFRPEYLNRLDEIVFYKPLSKENITGIIDLQIAALNRRLADKQLRCELTQAAKQFIIDAAYDPQFGARPLRRYVQHTVETLLAKKILEGSVQPGSTITVDTENGELVLR